MFAIQPHFKGEAIIGNVRRRFLTRVQNKIQGSGFMWLRQFSGGESPEGYPSMRLLAMVMLRSAFTCPDEISKEVRVASDWPARVSKQYKTRPRNPKP